VHRPPLQSKSEGQSEALRQLVSSLKERREVVAVDWQKELSSPSTPRKDSRQGPQVSSELEQGLLFSSVQFGAAVQFPSFKEVL
jgi:hypothetical protein